MQTVKVTCTAAEPNAGNGADMGGYSWTQTLGDVVLSVPVPPGTKGRQCMVDVKKHAISVGLAGAAPLLAGELWAPVLAEECFWNVDGRALEVTLQKARRALSELMAELWLAGALAWAPYCMLLTRACLDGCRCSVMVHACRVKSAASAIARTL